MAEEWSVLDEERVVSVEEAVARVSTSVDDGMMTTYFRSDLGRRLLFVSNGTRAMVVLMSGEGDPGEHAVSPDAVGSSAGYVLENGQEDTYEDADTIPLGEALTALRSIIDSGRPAPGTSWSVDQ